MQLVEGTKAELVFGASVNGYGVNELAAAVEAAGEKAVDDLVAEYEDVYDVAPELRVGGERSQASRRAVHRRS